MECGSGLSDEIFPSTAQQSLRRWILFRYHDIRSKESNIQNIGVARSGSDEIFQSYDIVIGVGPTFSRYIFKAFQETSGELLNQIKCKLHYNYRKTI